MTEADVVLGLTVQDDIQDAGVDVEGRFAACAETLAGSSITGRT